MQFMNLNLTVSVLAFVCLVFIVQEVRSDSDSNNVLDVPLAKFQRCYEIPGEKMRVRCLVSLLYTKLKPSHMTTNII